MFHDVNSPRVGARPAREREREVSGTGAALRAAAAYAVQSGAAQRPVAEPITAALASPGHQTTSNQSEHKLFLHLVFGPSV